MSVRDWDAYARENTRLWQRYYCPSPVYHPWATWDVWLVEYRALIVDVQDIYEAACRSARGPS